MARSSKRFVFVCPTCGTVNVQNNPTVDETTVMFCFNVSAHTNKQSRIMKLLSADDPG